MNSAKINHKVDLQLLQEIQKKLAAGELIVYPTETVWGLGGDIRFAGEQVEKISKLKGRDSSKAISILVRDIYQVNEYAEIDNRTRELIDLFWPGPLTLVLKAKLKTEKLGLGIDGFIGLRCSSHRLVREIFKTYEFPIFTTSANRSGEPSPTSREDVLWLDQDAWIVPWHERENVKTEQGVSKTATKPVEVAAISQGSTVIKLDQSGIYLLRQGDLPFSIIEREYKSF